MRVLVLLNGASLRRHPRGLPAALRAAARDAGHRVRVDVSTSLDHMLQLFGRAAESGADAIFVGGGDGTLHHAANHPLAPRVALGIVPLGTINAFARSVGMDHADPLRAFRQAMRGGVADGHCGLLGGRRFACFASWGFDARVVHRNSPALKKRIRAASYVVTGVREFANWRSGQVRGELRVDGTPRRATSVVVSKIGNYAGIRAFRAAATAPDLDALLAPDDSPLATLALWASLAARTRLARTHRIDGFRAARWRSQQPADVQLDGEAITLGDPRRFDVRVDPAGQRYWLP